LGRALFGGSVIGFPIFAELCYIGNMILVYNPAAFKHGFSEADAEAAVATALVDELIEGFDNKFLLIGFDMNGSYYADFD
jgi:hypothetical protein